MPHQRTFQPRRLPLSRSSTTPGSTSTGTPVRSSPLLWNSGNLSIGLCRVNFDLHSARFIAFALAHHSPSSDGLSPKKSRRRRLQPLFPHLPPVLINYFLDNAATSPPPLAVYNRPFRRYSARIPFGRWHAARLPLPSPSTHIRRFRDDGYSRQPTNTTSSSSETERC